MVKKNFIVLAVFLSLSCLFSSAIYAIGMSCHIVFASLLVACLGIPHGAIDHILFQKYQPQTLVYFYTFYLGAMLICLVFWYLTPAISFLLFLFLSAFHFGQSQFVGYGFAFLLRNVLYISWGVSILSGLIFYKGHELTLLSELHLDLIPLNAVLDIALVKNTFLGSTLIASILFLGLLWSRKWSIKHFLMESILLVLLHCAFYMLPFIVGFAIYFTVFHSLTVLTQEFSVLKNSLKKVSIIQFLRMLAPFTLLSIFGLSLTFFLTHQDYIPISYYFLIIVFISMLTVPHTIVMDMFYKGADKKLID